MKLFLVCEGPADDEDLRQLTMKVLHQEHPWMIDLESIAQPTPEWLEYEPGRRFLKWSDIGKAFEDRRLPPVIAPGRGLKYLATTRALRLSLDLVEKQKHQGARVVVVHDSDGDDDWRKSLAQARNEWREGVVRKGADLDAAVGIAHPEHEAWVLAAFQARNDNDTQRLALLRERLGFDPTCQGEQLTSGKETDKRDAKRALRELCDEERRRTLLREADLNVLRQRGEATGLTDFLDELRTRVATGYGHVADG